MATDWKYADDISDKIVELINAEMKRPDFSPTQMFAGQLCAMMAFLRSAQGIALPPALIEVQAAIARCLKTMADTAFKEPSP